MLRVAHDPGVRLNDIAATLGITERSVFGIVTDLTEAGCVAKQKDGRRNRDQIQGAPPFAGAHRPGAQHRRRLAVPSMDAGDGGTRE